MINYNWVPLQDHDYKKEISIVRLRFLTGYTQHWQRKQHYGSFIKMSFWSTLNVLNWFLLVSSFFYMRNCTPRGANGIVSCYLSTYHRPLCLCSYSAIQNTLLNYTAQGLKFSPLEWYNFGIISWDAGTMQF